FVGVKARIAFHPLSLHDALPISWDIGQRDGVRGSSPRAAGKCAEVGVRRPGNDGRMRGWCWLEGCRRRSRAGRKRTALAGRARRLGADSVATPAGRSSGGLAWARGLLLPRQSARAAARWVGPVVGGRGLAGCDARSAGGDRRARAWALNLRVSGTARRTLSAAYRRG